MMKVNEFRKNLDIYGADLNHWPPETKNLAQQALQDSAELREILEKERVFEAVLQDRYVEDSSPFLVNKINQTIHAESPSNIGQVKKLTLAEWIQGLWNPKPIFALVVVLILGFLVGYWSNLNGQVTGPEVDLASLLYNDEVISWETNLR